jgi:uncharacterized protein (TIGR03066 family)
MKKRPDRWWESLKQAVDRELQSKHNFRTPPSDAQGQSAATLETTVKHTPEARKWRLWSFLLLCLVGSGIVSFVIFKYIAPTIPHELIGTWEVTQGPLKGATLEFRWYGSAIATSSDKEGKKEITDSSVKVVGNKILQTTKHAITGKEDTVSQTILQLTENELVLRDEDRNTYAMTRVRK